MRSVRQNECPQAFWRSIQWMSFFLTLQMVPSGNIGLPKYRRPGFVILGSRPGLELGLVSSLPAGSDCSHRATVSSSWITTGTCAGFRVESSSCLVAGSDCCRYALVSMFVILQSRPGHELGLKSSPVFVWLLAQTAVAVLPSVVCDSRITSRP
jgi:hypothetical protein